MTAYLLSYKGYFEGLRVRTYPSAEAAQAVYDDPEDLPDHTSLVVSSDMDPDLGGPGLVGLYNALTGESVAKFESRTVGKRRVWDALVQKYQHQPHEQGASAPSAGSTEADVNQNSGEEDMAKKAKKKAKTKTKKPAGERAPRGTGKAAGKVADFRQVRDGTDRQKVLKLMNGQNTADQIADELGMDAKKVGTIVFCISRDCGIGYEFGSKGQLKALYPGDKTYKDAIKKAAE